jgi:superfamily I DNA and/or RNA helicase
MVVVLVMALVTTSTMIVIINNVYNFTFCNSKDTAGFQFTCCIVDEATQSQELETLIPLMLGVNTLVLVGDAQQLPATVLSKVRNALEPLVYLYCVYTHTHTHR